MIGDLGRYAGREQAYVKHFLLGEYLEIFAHKIGSAYPEIAYVDGFSGPWQNTGEAFEDTSFGIALAALTRAKATWKGLGRDLKVSAYLVEKNPAAYANLQSVRTLFPGVEIKTYPGSFIERAPELLKDIPARAFAFLFIDPKGWAIDMQRIAPLLKRPNSEVVFNFMFDFINRFAELQKPQVTASLDRLLVAPGWRAQLAASPDAGVSQAAVVQTDGVREILSRADGARLARINDHLSGVVFASPEAVGHTAKDGSPLVSWLFRPAASGLQRPPLIIIPYPGGPARAPSPTEADIATNVQLMVAAGYAVLIPSLPRVEHRGEPAEDMAADILRAVDAAALTGAFDPDRLVLWGHSFGAYSAVAAATQSSRFSAVIAANGPYDLLSVWGQFALPQSLAPEDGLPVRSRAGWVETGQGGLGAPPWTDPARYIRNSPVLSANRITVPVLLITADRDYVPPAQAQELFSALYRQQKDVVLVTYRGEGHVLSSPANIRDMYDTVWRWLDEVLARASPAAGVGPEPAQAPAR